MASEQLPDLLLWALPVLFVAHDAEEALFLPSWLGRNRNFLRRRFPRMADWTDRAASLSRSRFACMAAEELALLLLVTAYAFISHDYYPWLALFLAFALHLAGHLVQWAVVGRIFPAVVSSIPALAVCGWMLHRLIVSRVFDLREYLLCGVSGAVVAALNLWLLHAVAGTFRRR